MRDQSPILFGGEVEGRRGCGLRTKGRSDCILPTVWKHSKESRCTGQNRLARERMGCDLRSAALRGEVATWRAASREAARSREAAASVSVQERPPDLLCSASARRAISAAISSGRGLSPATSSVRARRFCASNAMLSMGRTRMDICIRTKRPTAETVSHLP